ncbi:MAG: CPBP family glutamic-type intramembrane protease [Candidatus Thorarchaeota archaeon]
MKATLSALVRRHQLAAFFVLAYAIMWILSIPTLLLPQEIVSQLLMGVAVFGPALACVIVSAITDPSPAQGSRRTFWIALVVTWVIVTTIATLYFAITTAGGLSLPAVMIYSLFSLTPAIVVAPAFSTIPGIRKSLSSLVKPKGNPVWYVIAIVIIPAALLLSVAITDIVGGEFLSEPVQVGGGFELAGLVLTSFAFTFIFSGGLNEEIGWTGFALPRFQARQSPLVASVSLWGLWMLWHMPFHFAGLWSPGLDALLHTLAGTFFVRFIFTWLYNRTNGGILSGVLLHTSMNVATDFIPVTNTQVVVVALIAAIVIVGDRMWKRLPFDGGEGTSTIADNQ